MFGTNKNESAILMMLSKQHHISMPQLQQKLEKEHNITLSTSQLYNVVKKLREAYILIKEAGSLTLNKIRVKQMNDYTKRINHLHDHEYANREYLSPGENELIYASTIEELDNIRVDKATIIAENHHIEHYYSYESHAYYILGMYETEMKIYKKFFRPEQKLYTVIGGDSVLDQYGRDRDITYRKKTIIDTTLPFSKKGYVIGLLGGYIIEIYFDSHIDAYFEQFFRETKNIEEFDVGLFSSIFRMKGKHKLIISHNPEQAKFYTDIIKKSFAL